MACLPVVDGIFQPEPAQYTKGKIGENLAPDHVYVGGSPWIAVGLRLTNGSGRCQEPESDAEAGRASSDLVVARRRHI